jgi:aldose 1-epimerase
MVPVSVTSTAVTLTGPGGELSATFLPGAGMICSSLVHRGEQLLGQRNGLEAYLERGSSFALPLLYPWANRLSGWDYDFGDAHVQLDPSEPLIHQDPDTAVPMHGVLAGCPDWRLLSASGTDLSAELDYGANPARLAAFPFPHRLEYGAELTDTALTVTLTVTPTSGLAVPVSFGFHPFLNPGGARASWELSGPVPGLDGPLGDRQFDAGHDGVPGGASFSVSSALRTLGVTFLAGYSDVQIFAPPGSDFVCFEPMTAPTDALRSGTGLVAVDPGRDFSASFAITVGP